MDNQVSIFDVANYFINSNYDPSSESFITPLKLQKLCYYTQAYSMSTYRQPMIDGNFEAWVHGPVYPLLYDKYKDYGMNAIEPEEEFDKSRFSNNQIKVLEYVQREYGIYDGKYLEYVTHQETPWKNARKGYASNERCNVVIKLEDMQRCYSKI